jgi:hypothetical protein
MVLDLKDGTGSVDAIPDRLQGARIG